MALSSDRSDRFVTRLAATATLLRLLILTLIALPVGAFYLTVLPYTINVPFADDYGSILVFLNNFAATHDISRRIILLISTQYNDYKLIFENSFAALYLIVFNKVNFSFLQISGNISVIFILLYLYLLWDDTIVDHHIKDAPNIRLISFLPITYILFQLNYWETLNFAMAGLQNLPVVAFALLCIWFLPKPGRGGFLAACVLFVLAAFSNGNGLLLAPVGALLLLQLSRYKRALLWAAISTGLASVYFYHYHSYVQVSGPISELPWQINLAYTLSFLGSAFANSSPEYHKSLIFGGVIISVISVLFFNKESIRGNIVILYSALFIVLTAVGVSAIRSRLGLGESLAPHYRIYSDVLLILCYLVVAKRIGGSRRLLSVVAVGAFALAARANLMARHDCAPRLQVRHAALTYDIAAGRRLGMSVLPIVLQAEPAAEGILARARELGIYALPHLKTTLPIPPPMLPALMSLISQRKSFRVAWQRLFLFYAGRTDLFAAFPPDSPSFYRDLLHWLLTSGWGPEGGESRLYPYRAEYETMLAAITAPEPRSPPAFVSAPKAKPVADCWIDAVDGQLIASIKGPVPVSGWVSLHGWTAPSVRRGIGPDATWISLTAADGKRRFYKAKATNRPDVLAYFKKPRMKDPGFSANLDLSGLSGNQKLTVYSVHGKKAFHCSQHVLLTVRP